MVAGEQGRDHAPEEPATPTWETDRIGTLPNALSLLRLTGVPLFLWLVLAVRADGWAVLVLALGGVTDWLDGFLARRWHQTSRLGRLLDPIADRLYILAVLLGLAFRDIIPWWLAALVVGRDVMIALLLPPLRARGYWALPVNLLGKAATFCLLYAFPLVLLGADSEGWLRSASVLGWTLAIGGTVLYWYAGVVYLRQGIRLMRTEAPRARVRPR